MKNVYVILSVTPTLMGKIVRLFTRSSFNHSSISLTEDWNEMYSFARYRASNPLVGGFVKEFPQRLSLGKDRNVYIEVYKIPVSDKQFDEIERFIYNIKNDEEENIYNFRAAINILFGCKSNTYKAYTCSDFVAKSLMIGDIISQGQTSQNIIPDDIRKLIVKYICFRGCLNNYSPVNGVLFNTEDFFIKTNLINEIARTYRHFYSMITRGNRASYSNLSEITKN
jgi:hypothetical protein